MVVGMLFIGIPQAVSSAKSGYQIVFTGLASLIQAFANKQLNVKQF